MSIIDLIGLGAGAFTIAAFYAVQPVALRCLAIIANAMFLIYGNAIGLVPVVVLHCVLLPLNVFRLHQAAGRDAAPPLPDQPMARELHIKGWPSQRAFRAGSFWA